MKSKPLKYVLLVILIAVTLLSFRYAPRTRDKTPQPSESPAPPVVVQQESILPAPVWAGNWNRYVYAGEQFSFEMPEMPFAYESSRSVGPLDNTEPVRTFGLYSDGVVFLVTSFSNPGDGERPEYFAAYHWEGVVFANAGAVNSGMLRGEEYLASGEYYTRSRVFFVQNRAYLVCAMSFDPDDPRVQHFLDSFDIGVESGAREIHDPPPDTVKVPVEPPVTGKTPNVGVNVNAGAGVGPGSGVPRETPTPEPFKGDKVTRKAIVVFKPPPGFTEEARKNGVTGTVRLRVVLAADGNIANVSVLKALPYGLTERALDSAHHMLFFPAVKDGHAVSQYVTLEYNFNIY